MERYKGCDSDEIVKNGKTRHDKQRFRCKNCSCNYIVYYHEGDGRLKHEVEKHIKVIKMHLKGAGMRSTARLEEKCQAR